MREVRKLYSPVHGAVSSLCELNTGGERHRGEGFAVSARSCIIGWLLLPKCSPPLTEPSLPQRTTLSA